jgi:methionyl-tRNA synthetase
MEPTTPPSATPVQDDSDLIDIDHFRKIKLRVARIDHVEPVPKSKKLLKLQVFAGEELGSRQILAGIAQHYSPEDLVGRKIVIVTNLAPVQLMGTESQGMLLAASDADVTRLVLLDPGQDMTPGDLVK